MNASFVWWTGVVEDRDDPEMIGRCRVRILGYHSKSTTDIPTDELPWAYPAMPINTRPRGTPLGPVEGTWVMGFFKDGESAQQPVMTHTLDSGYQAEGNEGDGFNDPGDGYREEKGYPERPKRNWWPGMTGGFVPDDGTIDEDWPAVDENKVNRLARGDTEGTWVDWADERRVTGIESAAPNHSWDEPESDYNAQYPFNKVEESESGHVFEVDDTPGHERISRRHKSGSYEELQNDGRVIKIHGDDYEIIVSHGRDPLSGSKHIYVDGNVNISAVGDVNIKTTEGTIRIDSDKSIRMKADDYILMEAGLGVMVDGMFFSTANGCPILNGGGSPMVVPTGIPMEMAPDFGLKYAATGVSKLQNMVKNNLDVPPEMKDALKEFEESMVEVQEVMVEAEKEINKVKVVAESSIDTVEDQMAVVEAVSKTSISWRDKIDASVENAMFLQSRIKDPKLSTLAWADSVMGDVVKNAMGDVQQLGEDIHGSVVNQSRETFEKLSSGLVDRMGGLESLKDTLSAANATKDRIKSMMRSNMKKMMVNVSKTIAMGKIAFSIYELVNMLARGRADREDPANISPYVLPKGVRQTIIFAGRYVIGKEYKINDLGMSSWDWEEQWKMVAGRDVKLEPGATFTARTRGGGTGSAVLEYFVMKDESTFSRTPAEGIVAEARKNIVDGRPVLMHEETKKIDTKDKLLAIIEMFLIPLGRSESEYFQTWLTDADFNNILERSMKGIENYRSPEDLRRKLRALAREKQSEHIPYILDVFVESGDLAQDMDVSGLFDRSAVQGVYEDRASVLSLKPSGSDRRDGYNFSTLLDKDAVLEYSISKRLSGDLGEADFRRLEKLEKSYGIALSETLEVAKFKFKGIQAQLDRGHDVQYENVRTRTGSGKDQTVYYKAEASYNTSISGKGKAQIVAGDELLSGLRREMRSLKKEKKHGNDQGKAMGATQDKIEKLAVKIRNTEKLNGKVFNVSTFVDDGGRTTIKRQDSNLGFVKPPVEQEFVGAPILKITKKEAQNLQDLIKGLIV